MRTLAVFGFLLFGCNVDSTGWNSGGVRREPLGPEGCPSGLTVLLSDFVSTQVALSTLDGTTLSPSFLHSGSTETDGVSFPFSGDVVLPSERPLSGRVVLIDRFGTNVLSFADPHSARVLGQLALATGFQSNPQDYIEVGRDLAYVSRSGHNSQPGRQPFDEGSDVLLIDTAGYRIVKRIAVAAPGDSLPPRPGPLARLDKWVLVTLGRLSLDYRISGDSELVAIDSERDTVAWRVRLPGLSGCGRAALSPDGAELALACTGHLSFRGEVADIANSGLAVLDARMSPPTLVARIAAETLAQEPIQSGVVFASDSTLLFKTQTPIDGSSHNRLLALDRRSESVQPILEATPSSRANGQGVVYGAVVCSPGCSELCWLADANLGVLQRLLVDEQGRVNHDGPVMVEDRVGLPPRDIAYR